MRSKMMNASVSFATLFIAVLLFTSALVHVGASGEMSRVLGVKRQRRGPANEDDDTPTAKRMPPKERTLGWVADQRARMLQRIHSQYLEESVPITHSERGELMRELFQDCFTVLIGSILESLVVAPTSELKHEILSFRNVFIGKLSLLLQLVPGDATEMIDCVARESTKELEQLMDDLEERFGGLRSAVFKDMDVKVKKRIFDLLLNAILQFVLELATIAPASGAPGYSEYIKELEGELDKLENRQAFEISKLVPVVADLLTKGPHVSSRDRINTMMARSLGLVLKYLEGELPLDLQGRIGLLSVVTNDRYFQLVFSTLNHDLTYWPSGGSLYGKFGQEIMFESRGDFDLEVELHAALDEAVRTLMFQVKTVELMRHVPGLPEEPLGVIYLFKPLEILKTRLDTFVLPRARDRCPKIQQKPQSYREAFAEYAVKFARIYLEHKAGRPVSEMNSIVSALRHFDPNFEESKLTLAMSTKGAHKVVAEGDSDGKLVIQGVEPKSQPPPADEAGESCKADE